MEFNIDILKLSREVFGVSGYLPVSKGQRPTIAYRGVKTFEYDDPEAISMFGTPVYNVIEFGDLNKPDLVLEDAPLITPTRKRKIVTEDVNDEDDPVIEFISNGPWTIDIRGLLVNTESMKKPYDKAEQMNLVMEGKRAWPIRSRWLNKLGISDIVILDYGFPAIEGFMNVIPYTIQAMSAKPIELQLQ